MKHLKFNSPNAIFIKNNTGEKKKSNSCVIAYFHIAIIKLNVQECESHFHDYIAYGRWKIFSMECT